MRWLSIDDPSYLTSESPAGYNLYVYCNNNPIMYEDPSGDFCVTVFIVTIVSGIIIGGVLGGVTAYQNGAVLGSEEFWTGVATGALIGGAVGAVAGLTFAGAGFGYLLGGLSSAANKLISDTISSLFYQTNNFGNWEDYAVAFVIGGLINGTGATGILKSGLETVARPLFSQISKMGTRGAEFNRQRFVYDIVTRSLTMEMGMNTLIFGLAINLSKSLSRGLLSGLGKIIYG